MWNISGKRRAAIGVLILPLVLAAGCAGGGSGLNWPKGAPSEVTYLLPKFECAQAPTAALCCPAAGSSVVAADGCCKAHGQIMDARTAAVKAAHPEYSNEQVLNAILGPFTPAENTQYVQGCCETSSNKTCCLGAMGGGGDMSSCGGGGTTTGGSSSLAALTCAAAPENMTRQNGKDVIIGLDPKGQLTKITVSLQPSGTSSAGGGTSDVSALLTSLNVGRIEFSQTKGDVTAVPDGGLVSGPSALSGTTLVMKNEAAPGAVPAALMTFSAPPPQTGADVKATPSHDYSFVAVAYNAGGQAVLTANVDCPAVALSSFGGGCGCRMTSDPTPQTQFLTMWRNLMLTLVALLTPWYLIRKRIVSRNKV